MRRGRDAASSSSTASSGSDQAALEAEKAAEETVEMAIAKLNAATKGECAKHPIDSSNVQVVDDCYYFNVFEDVSLYVLPVSYSGDQAADVAEELGVYVPTNSANLELMRECAKYLLIASNESVDEAQAAKLIEEADASEGAGANVVSNGIWFGRDDMDGGSSEGSVRYFVTRNYV